MDDQQYFKERVEANFFVQTFQRYFPFWPLFVVAVAISLACSYLYLRSQIPIFVAQAKVLLKDPNKGGGDSKVLDALNIFGEKKIVENELVVLRSSNLMQEVVKELKLYSNVYNEGRVRTEELYKDNSPVWFEALQVETIVPSGKYYFTIDWNRQFINIDNRSVKFDSTILLGNTSYRARINPTYNRTVTAAKNYFVKFNSVEGSATTLISSLKAMAISISSTVLDVKLETPVPQKGLDVLGKLFEIYNRNAIIDKNLISAKTIDFIEDRLRVVISQLDSVEKNVASFRSREAVYDLSTQARMYLENVKDLDKKNTDVDIQLSVINDINNYVRNKGSRQGTVPSLLLLNEPILSSLLAKLYEAELQLDKAKSISGEKSDAVLLSEEQVSNLKNNILENVSAIKRNLLSVKNEVSSNIGANTGLLRQIPQKERAFIDISRQQAIKNNIYTFLLQKREETAISSASTIADLRIIETPNAYGPIKPIANNYYLIGFIIGLFIPVIYILIHEQFNRKILFRAEIEEKTKVPMLAEIVQVGTKEPIVISEGKRTVVAEQFRSLRTNLSFMGINDQHKTILVTSSIPSEGKSFIAINLAISITLTGKKVALLELDLRKPKLSKILQIPRDPGISNYLIGKATIDDIIKKTAIKDLFIISAGPIPPNPTELIIAENFKAMMSQLKDRFDFLIIDTAPTGPVSDAQLLKDFADTTLYVVRHDKTPKVLLSMINDLYENKKFKNMGLVFNGLKSRGISWNKYGGYGGYGQGYGYGYGYGYGGGYGGGYYVEEEKKSFFSSIKNIFRKKR